MKGKLREFHDSDLGAVKDLIDETVSACYSEYPVEYREHLAEEHHSRKRILDRAREGFTLVLEYEGRIMGSGTLIGDSIQGVFVHPSHQRKGFGKAIMRELEERALEKGVKTVSLESTPLSKGFYDSLGYATLEEATFSVGKRSFTYYKMAKELRAREAPHSG